MGSRYADRGNHGGTERHRRAGKALYIGASSMYAWQFAKAQRVAQENGWSRFVSMQNHYNLVYREEEREMIPQCLDQGVGIIPWSPLARGFLAGNRSATKQDETTRSRSDDFAHSLYYQESDFQVVDAASQVAAERGVKPAQVALAWMLGKSFVTAPIVGASKMYQLEEAVAATELRLTEDEVKAVETPYVPHRVLGHG